VLWAPCRRRQLSGAAELNFQTVALECVEHAGRLGLLAARSSSCGPSIATSSSRVLSRSNKRAATTVAVPISGAPSHRQWIEHDAAAIGQLPESMPLSGRVQEAAAIGPSTINDR
jgi:hypothetical protein